MSSLLHCAYCQKFRNRDGGQFNVGKNKLVKFRCKECKSKIVKPRRVI